MNYCHAIATYAIAEAYGMQNDPTSNTLLREPLLRGVRYILQNQNPDGGWRYLKGQKSDISMSGWQLMALKSAEIAGVNIPRSAKAEVVAFLKAAQPRHLRRPGRLSRGAASFALDDCRGHVL